MKKIILPGILASSLFLLMGLSSCKTSSQRVADAKENVHEANLELDQAEQDHRRDMAAYRLQAGERLRANAKSMDDFNARLADDRADAKADYKKRMHALQKRNTDLHKRLDDFKADNRSDWKRFKIKFDREMDDISRSLKDLTHKD